MMGSLTTVRGLGRISMCTSVSYEIGRLGFGGDSVTPNAAVVYILHTTSFSFIKNESMGIAGAYTGYSRTKSVHAPSLLYTVQVVQPWLHDSTCLIYQQTNAIETSEPV